MLPGFLRALWGDLSKKELKKFSMLSCIITLILGNYWMLRVLKNPIFNDLVGMEYQPYAKMFSIVVVALIILIYSKLIDLFDKKTLFDIICAFYGIILFFICVVTLYPENFLISSSSKIFPMISWIPGKLIGWISYFTFESYSLLMILFWSFVASITKPESAKKGYAMIITCTQVGTISGPALVTHYATKIGSPLLVGLGAILVLLVPLLVRLYMVVIPKEDIPAIATADANTAKTGFFAGVKLIVTNPYVMGILVVSTIYEIIATILEFQMNMIAKEVFTSRDAFAAFTV
jgi:AAA family ATP:ADP antiporter